GRGSGGRAAARAPPPRRDPLLEVLAKDERRVRAAEAEGVRQRDLDVLLARLVRHVVEVAVRIRRFVVDRRRQDAVVQCEHGRDRLHAAGGAEEVARHRLRGRDGEPPGVLAEDALDRERLELVVVGRGRSVRVDVPDLGGVEPRVAQGGRHRARGAVPLGVGRGHVVRVARHPVADDLRVDPGVAADGVLKRLEHEHPGALAPKRMDTSPDAMLTIIIGMKKGDTRSGPFSRRVSWVLSRVWIPPIPEPISTPKRSPSTFAVSSPASSTAITLQAIAYWRNGSRRRASRLSTYFSRSKFRTSAAIRVG